MKRDLEPMDDLGRGNGTEQRGLKRTVLLG
jgi:hypothetical protein